MFSFPDRGKYFWVTSVFSYDICFLEHADIILKDFVFSLSVPFCTIKNYNHSSVYSILHLCLVDFEKSTPDVKRQIYLVLFHRVVITFKLFAYYGIT